MGQDDGEGADLRDRIHGVRLEVERVRAKMATMHTGLSGRIGEEVGKVRTELSEQIGGLEKSLRAWLAVGVSFIAVLVALMSGLN